MKRFFAIFSVFITLSQSNSFAQLSKSKWVDSVYNNLSETEKIGQLFMVAAYSGTDKYNETQINQLVSNNQIGGVIFMQGTPEKQATLTNQYQNNAKVPLLVGMDAEWGLGMRLTGVRNFPRQMMIGATRDEKLMEEMATAVAYQCARLGVHIDFAPVIDVNNNPLNPVINFRSFGEDKYWVAKLGLAYMRGLQDNGILASAKHFPGHGDVAVDSHHDLPIINKTKAQLDTLEFYPFKELIKGGVKSIMVAHLSIPALDPTKNQASTLSYNIITNILKKEMNYEGLIFTDALNMEGVAKYYAKGDVDYKAFLAGNDVLLFSQDVPIAIQKIQAGLKSGQITQKRLEHSVKKILSAKYEVGLSKFTPIDPNNATADLNKYTDIITQKIANKSITVTQDPNGLLSLTRNPNVNIAYVAIGKSDLLNIQNENFAKRLKKQYPNIQFFEFKNNATTDQEKNIYNQVSKYNIVIVGMHDLSLYPKDDYGINFGQLRLLKNLSSQKNTIFVNFGNPYALKYVCGFNTQIVTYEENVATYNAAIEVLSGNLAPKGILPVTACSAIKQYTPTQTVKDPIVKSELVNTQPTNAKTEFAQLDDYINRMMDKGAFPGCQIYAMRNGKVIYDKQFGKLSTAYNAPKVTSKTLYDIASVTKIAATTLAVMKLYEEGKLDLNATLATYLPEATNTNKANLKIKDILLHQAGLVAWIPFYKSTIDENKQPKLDLYKSTRVDSFSVPITQNLYMKYQYIDTVWQQIWDSKVVIGQGYVYSDLDFLILQKVVEKISNKSLNKYVTETFYNPMNLSNMMYNPWRLNLENLCAPTENDNYYRNQVVQGYVHDMGAAMLGGASGHAGLFSNAEDLADLMQMLMNGGVYKGKRYFKQATIDLFTKYSGNGSSRRALGFDKPTKEEGRGGPASSLCSNTTFGHQGFTGTCAWADPTTGIVFVFLSNRTYPTQNNNLINTANIRQEAQKYIYKGLGF